MSKPDVHALAGAYAVDAVDDLERAAFERHLADCEACATEVAEHRETATQLVEGTWAMPPPRMREQVLARAAATPQVSAVGRRRSTTSPVTRWRWIAAAAAAVGVLGLGSAAMSYIALERRLDDQRIALEAAQERREVMTAPDAALRRADLDDGGRVSVVVSDTRDTGVVFVVGAPPPGPDRVYQLWLVPAGSATPVSAGLLPAGEAQVTQLIEGVRGRTGFVVTLEPAGGSVTPSAPALVDIPLV